MRIQLNPPIPRGRICRSPTGRRISKYVSSPSMGLALGVNLFAWFFDKCIASGTVVRGASGHARNAASRGRIRRYVAEVLPWAILLRLFCFVLAGNAVTSVELARCECGGPALPSELDQRTQRGEVQMKQPAGSPALPSELDQRTLFLPVGGYRLDLSCPSERIRSTDTGTTSVCHDTRRSPALPSELDQRTLVQDDFVFKEAHVLPFRAN